MIEQGTPEWHAERCGKATAFKIADIIVGLRVSEEEEREGLDINSHGETAYHV